MRFGSFTFLYMLPTNVLRAMWLLASSFIGTIFSSWVCGSMVGTALVIFAKANSSLIALLYSPNELWGINVFVFLLLLTNLSRRNLALLFSGTRTVLPLFSLVLLGIYSTQPLSILSVVNLIKSLKRHPIKLWDMKTSR